MGTHTFDHGNTKGSHEFTLNGAGAFAVEMVYMYSSNIFESLAKVNFTACSDYMRDDEVTLKCPTEIPVGSKFSVQWKLGPSTGKNKFFGNYKECLGLWSVGAEAKLPPTIMTSTKYVLKEEGEVDFEAPKEPSTYELRMLFFSGLEQAIMKSLKIDFVKENPKIEEKSQKESQNESQNQISAKIVVPKYDSWNSLFTAASIDENYVPSYNAIVNSHKLDINHLKNVDFPFLSSVGIATPAHQLAIMNKINEIKEAETKQFIAEEIARQLGPNKQ